MNKIIRFITPTGKIYKTFDHSLKIYLKYKYIYHFKLFFLNDDIKYDDNIPYYRYQLQSKYNIVKDNDEIIKYYGKDINIIKVSS